MLGPTGAPFVPPRETQTHMKMFNFLMLIFIVTIPLVYCRPLDTQVVWDGGDLEFHHRTPDVIPSHTLQTDASDSLSLRRRDITSNVEDMNTIDTVPMLGNVNSPSETNNFEKAKFSNAQTLEKISAVRTQTSRIFMMEVVSGVLGILLVIVVGVWGFQICNRRKHAEEIANNPEIKTDSPALGTNKPKTQEALPETIPLDTYAQTQATAVYDESQGMYYAYPPQEQYYSAYVYPDAYTNSSRRTSSLPNVLRRTQLQVYFGSDVLRRTSSLPESLQVFKKQKRASTAQKDHSPRETLGTEEFRHASFHEGAEGQKEPTSQESSETDVIHCTASFYEEAEGQQEQTFEEEAGIEFSESLTSLTDPVEDKSSQSQQESVVTEFKQTNSELLSEAQEPVPEPSESPEFAQRTSSLKVSSQNPEYTAESELTITVTRIVEDEI